jgi:hypothetical protein
LFLAAFFTILGIYEYIRKKKIQSGWFFKNSKRRRE